MPRPSMKAVISSFMPVRSSGCGDMECDHCTAWRWSLATIATNGCHGFPTVKFFPVNLRALCGEESLNQREHRGPQGDTEKSMEGSLAACAVSIVFTFLFTKKCFSPKNMWAISPAKS